MRARLVALFLRRYRSSRSNDAPIVVPAPPDQTPPGFTRLCSFDELEDQEIAEFVIDDVALAVARLEGEYFALSNVCPHAGGPLGDGVLTGGEVVCPLHGWAFDVRSGKCSFDESLVVATFEVRTDRKSVWIRLNVKGDPL